MSFFDERIDRRNSQSIKWDMMETIYNIEDASSILPMWVADMDFAAPAVLIEAIQKRLQHPVLGYSKIGDGVYNAIIDWFARRYNWHIEKDTILFQQGVIPALATIIETFTEKGDTVSLFAPAYPPFFNIPKELGRTVAFCPLIEKNGHYEIDYTSLENSFKQNKPKIFINCNPQNPGGNKWSTDELQKLLDLCIQYDVLLIADEIHADLCIDEKFTPTLTLKNTEQAKIISCIAPTKTFNLAGIQAAMMIVPNAELRKQLQHYMSAHGQMGLSVFSATAVQAVYENGEPWLEELLDYLRKNMEYALSKLNDLTGISVSKSPGTYLLWIDYRKTGLSEKEIMHRLLTIGQVALDPGTKFGSSGEGFLRLNIACPLSTLQDGIERITKSLIDLA